MRISFVIAPYDIIGQCYGSQAKKTKYGFWPPMGIGILAACVMKAGHTAEIIDAPAKGWGVDNVIEHLKKTNPDVIGLSAPVACKAATVQFISQVKEKFDVPVILGGQLATIFPDQMLNENPGLHYIFMGEAEETIVELLDHLEKKKDVRKVAGLVLRDGDRILHTSPRATIDDLDSIPRIAYELYDFSLYTPLPLQYKELPIAPYMSSRGCPYHKCAFCFQSGKFAQKWRRNSPERVVADMKCLKENFGIREVAFWDDIFLIDIKWLTRFCELIEQEKLDMTWQCYGYGAVTTKPMLELAKKHGCWAVFYGIESGNQNSLDLIGKGFTLEKMRQVVQWTHEAGLDTRASFILGLPGETPELAMNTMKYAIDLDVTFAEFVCAFPEFGTRLYAEMEQKGQPVYDFEGRHSPVYLPEGYRSKDELSQVMKKVYRGFHLRPAYIWKHLKRVRSPALVKQYWDALWFVMGIAFKKTG